MFTAALFTIAVTWKQLVCPPTGMGEDAAHIAMGCSVCALSGVQLFATPWTIACQAPLSTEFSKQEYCSGMPFPTPGGLPNPGTKPTSPASPASAGGFFYHLRHLGSPTMNNYSAIKKKKKERMPFAVTQMDLDCHTE